MDGTLYSAHDLVKVPGLLSLARAPLGAAFVATVRRPRVALAMLALSGLSDVLDGWSARTLGQATPTGAVLDAVMDKLFVGVVAGGLLARHVLSERDLLLLGAREVGELLLAGRLAMGDGALARRRAPHPFGKATTVLQYAAIAAAVLGSSLRRPLVVATAAVGLAAAVVYAARDLGAHSSASGARA